MRKLSTLSEIVAGYDRFLHWEANRIGYHGVSHDDIVQEGRIQIWRSLPTWQASLGPRDPYLMNAASWRMVDFAWHGKPAFGHESMRGSRPAQTRLGDADYWRSLEQHWTCADHADQAQWAYHRGEIRQALDRLSPEQRRYVVLRFWGGLEPGSRAPGAAALRRGQEMPPRAWEGPARAPGIRQELEYALRHLNPYGD